MRVGQIIRLDFPSSSTVWTDKVEVVHLRAIMAEIRRQTVIESDDEGLERAIHEILVRKFGRSLHLLTIYRRTSREYDCHIQYTRASGEETQAPAPTPPEVVFTLRDNQQRDENITGSVRIDVNGIRVLDFDRYGCHIMMRSRVPEGAAVRFRYHVMGNRGVCDVQGHYRNGVFTPNQPIPNPILNSSSADLRRPADGAAIEMRQVQFSHEYLLQVNNSFNPLNEGNVRVVVAEAIHRIDSEAMRITGIRQNPENLTVTAFYMTLRRSPQERADSRAEGTDVRNFGSTVTDSAAQTPVAAQPDPHALPDSTIRKTRPAHRIHLQDENSSGLRQPREDILADDF